MSEKFVSMTEVKDYCKIEQSDVRYDSVLDLLNEHITAAIKGWLGRNITVGTYSESFDVEPAQQTVFLSQYPVISLAGVTEGGTSLTEGADFYLYPATGVIKMIPKGASREYWDGRLKKVEVSYHAGYAEIPKAIKHAALRLIHREFYDRGADDIQKVEIGSYRHTRFNPCDGMPPGVYTLLHPYRRQFR